MSNVRFKTGLSVMALFAFVLLFFTRCKEDDTEPNIDGEKGSAILYTGRYSTPDGRKFLMGAFDEVPQSDPDISKLTELEGSSVSTFAANGYVFTWNGDASTITKWTVESDNSFIESAVLSLQSTGIAGNNFAHVVLSETVAYTPAIQDGIIVKWNPETMEIEKTITITAPPTTLDSYVFRSHLSGDNVYIPLEIGDWDNLKTDKKAIVAVFNTTTEVLTYATDDRRPPSSRAYVDEIGDFYMLPWSTTLMFNVYGDETGYPAHSNVLRIKSGETTFDAGFSQNIDSISKGAGVISSFYLGNNKLLVQEYGSEDDYPADEDLWDFTSQLLRYKLVDLVAETSVDFPGTNSGYSGNNNSFMVDGKHYYQSPNKVTGVTAIGVIDENGFQKTFEISGGDLNALYRIR